jgi:tRNA pseudouridine55 synthase
MPSGFLLVDKPVDWTSHDVVGYLRGVTKIKKIGHAGTLDPFATGLLIVAVQREATKRIDEFHTFTKTYIATIQLGAVSNTQDKTGTITQTKNADSNIKNITKQQIEETLKQFTGKQLQTPPMFSAKKVKGKKLYELARKGIEIERMPNEIEIYNIQLLEYKNATLKITCEVSTGTYIRTLAHDIGQALGVGAYCEELRRTSIGAYSVEDALPPKVFMGENWTDRLL